MERLDHHRRLAEIEQALFILLSSSADATIGRTAKAANNTAAEQ
jgi:hypothetical protein